MPYTYNIDSLGVHLAPGADTPGRLRLQHALCSDAQKVTDKICEHQLWSDRTISEDGPRISGSQSPLTGVSHTLTSSRPTTNDERVTTVESGFRGLTTRQLDTGSTAAHQLQRILVLAPDITP